MRHHPVSFPGASGAPLVGRLTLPEGEPLAWALFAHCFTCTKDIRAARQIAGALAAEGVGVLRFDFTGLGESGGAFSDTNFSSNVEDLVAAARFMEGEGRPVRLLVGHSLGGAASIAAGGRLPEVRAVATVAAPADLSHLSAKLIGPLRLADGLVRIGPGVFRVRPQLLEDLAAQRMEAHVRALRRPLLLLHAPSDDTVPVAHAGRLFAAAEHPRAFVSLDEADHLLSRPEDGAWAGRLIATWASRYLGPR
ncbi:MAG: alpha/beta fold hydrolase [Deltaproteobacteria bacterium]|nr:alpha/beta fold hydrolase [Deltaproteobacteria bacterium]